MDGEMAYWADEAEFRRLTEQGFATAVGPRKLKDGVYELTSVKLLRLTAPLGVVSGDVSGTHQLPIRLSQLTGQRYVKKERTESGKSYYEHFHPRGANKESFYGVIASISGR
jgi:hypothetical protein